MLENPKVAGLQVESRVMPLLAEALAPKGDLGGAQDAIHATPLDCYDCLRLRGRC